MRRASPMAGCATSPSPPISLEVSTITTRLGGGGGQKGAMSGMPEEWVNPPGKKHQSHNARYGRFRGAASCILMRNCINVLRLLGGTIFRGKIKRTPDLKLRMTDRGNRGYARGGGGGQAAPPDVQSDGLAD